MDSDSTRADVEERLRETADAMADRFDSLQDEVSTTGSSLRDWVVQNPLKSVGGMLAAGVAVGALVGGGRSRRPEHAELLDQYIDALRTEVEEAMATGDTPGEAVEKALRGRAPLGGLVRGQSLQRKCSGQQPRVCGAPRGPRGDPRPNPFLARRHRRRGTGGRALRVRAAPDPVRPLFCTTDRHRCD